MSGAQRVWTRGRPPGLAGGQAPLQRPDVALRSADATAEAYNNREDREARQAEASRIGDAMFRLGIGGLDIRGKRQAYAELSGQRADLVAGGEKVSAGAAAARDANKTTLANTGLEQAGQDRRSQLDAGTALQVAQMGNSLERAKLAQPQFPVAEDGRLVRLTPDGAATPVDFADGSPLKMPVPANGSMVTGRDAIGFFQDQMKAAADIIRDPASSEEDKASAREAYAAASSAGQSLIPSGHSMQRMSQTQAIAKARELVVTGQLTTAQVKAKLLAAGYKTDGL